VALGAHGAVSSQDPLATEAGLAVLQRGGNAVDAAIAVAFALAATHPASGNVGGGGFMVVRMADGRAAAIDYRETAPAGATRDMYLDKHGKPTDDSVRGPKAAGIPGTVGGAVVGNAGAWGKQVGDVLKSAVILDEKGRPKTVGPEYFGFSYRHSKLKETNEIIVEVTFDLKPGDSIALARERADILRQRAQKHPDLSALPCAGSFFRNIEPTSKAERRQASGWFLEQAGGKNLKAGRLYFRKTRQYHHQRPWRPCSGRV
jgi:gamma-glutamyltranspeptidase